MNESKLTKLIIGLIKIDDCLKNYRVYFSYGVVPNVLIVKIFKGDTVIRPFKEYNIDLKEGFDVQANICMNELEFMVTGEINK